MSRLGIEEGGKKREKAMQARLKNLGTATEIEPDDAYEDFEIVHDLVSAAFSEFAEGEGNLKEAMTNLAEAIKSAADNMAGSEDT